MVFVSGGIGVSPRGWGDGEVFDSVSVLDDICVLSIWDAANLICATGIAIPRNQLDSAESTPTSRSIPAPCTSFLCIFQYFI